MSLFESQELKNLSRYVRGYLGGLRSLHMDIEGEEFKYLEGGEGETVIFLHGLMGSKTQWRSVMQAYTQDYRVVAIDVPGLCLQKAFAQKKHTLRQLALWLERVIEKLRCTKVHLVCHSMGCAIGAYFAATRSEQVASSTFLAFPDVFSNRGQMFRELMDEVIGLLDNQDMNALSDYYRRSYFSPPNIPNIVLRYNLREVVRRRDQVVTAMLEVADSSPLLLAQIRHIKSPCLVLYGDSDQVSPVFPKEFWELNVPDHRYVTLPECGHVPHLEKPDDFIQQHRQFIERCARTSKTAPTEDTGKYGIILD